MTYPGIIHDHENEGKEDGRDLSRSYPTFLIVQGVEVRDAVEAPEVEDVFVNVQAEVQEEGEGLEDRMLSERVTRRRDGEVKDKEEVYGHCCDVQMLMY
jgi:hypothetical protein